ncbi:MAG: dihydrolipoyl dehydrogenase family protein [Thermodesulfobacteriota bacterium]
MERYDLVVIGGGVAGLVISSGAAQFGARVALVDKGRLGGDCLWSGCVPTKRLVYTAKVASLIRRAPEFGIFAGDGPKVDFPRVMELMREVQARIGENDDPERFRKMGVDVIPGQGSFIDGKTFEVNGRKLTARRFVVATGSGPVILPIPGLREAGALTNETALELKELPESIAILGAGPIGMEFAQVFARLGSKVTVIEKMDQVLPKEDKEISDMLGKVLEAEGIKIEVCTEVKDVRREGGRVFIKARCSSGEKTYETQEVMIAIGRAPNVEGLGLEAAGVIYDKRKGIKVDASLLTSNKRVYACGDVVGQYAFTHVAEYHAGIVLSNALFPLLTRKVDYRVVPWTTFTDPELARVGLTEQEARTKFATTVSVYRHFFNANDRAVIEGEGNGIIKLVCDKHQRILGAHILGPHAGEMLPEYVLAMKLKAPITKISQSIHVYPTVAQGLKRAADQYYKEKLFGDGWFPRLARWLVKRGHKGQP